MNTLLTNRDFKLPEDGWIQITPLGEFPTVDKKHVQVIDDEAVTAMTNRFKKDSAAPNFPGLLVDFDHFSDDPDQASVAAGWIDELQNRAGAGLWGHVRFSSRGKAAAEGGEYRLVSPVWDRKDCQTLEKNRVRPLRLDRLALTNDPNIKGMEPISNRADDAAPPHEEIPLTNRAATRADLSAAPALRAATKTDLRSAH